MERESLVQKRVLSGSGHATSARGKRRGTTFSEITFGRQYDACLLPVSVRQARRRRQVHLKLPLIAAVGVEVALEPDGDRPHHAAPLHRDELSQRHSLQFVRADPAQIELGDRARLVEQLFSLNDDDL